MNDWIEKNRLVFLMFSDYKNIIFGKEFNVKRIMDLKEATKILTPIIINKVTRNIKEQINDVILDYGNSDSIETMLKVEQNKDLFLEIKDRA